MDDHDERGVTIIELVTVLAIMSVFLVMFTAGILQLSHTSSSVEANAKGQAQLDVAFIHLDQEIRFATQISQPATVNGDAYVEYLAIGSGTRTCAELRVDASTGQLQHRTWQQGASPLAPTTWQTLAAGVTASAGPPPFTLVPADATYNMQRLRIHLEVSNPGSGGPVLRQTDVAFAALDSSMDAPDPTVCTEGRTRP